MFTSNDFSGLLCFDIKGKTQATNKMGAMSM